MSQLYSTGKIGQLALRNRLIMTAMHLAYCPGGEVTDKFVEFYRARARGGVGLVVIGAIGIDPLRVCQHDMVQIYEDRFLPGLRRLCDAVHAEGAGIFAQLWHGGRYARSREYRGLQAVAPSAVHSRFTGEIPRELTRPEITEIISFFASGAKRAKNSGFDGVEIAGSAGYLISQFLSPLTNKRQDRYGGDLPGRMTFALEIVAAVRQQVGPEFPIMVRLAGNDFMEGGNANFEARQFAMALEKAGVDALSVTGGWHETHVPQITMEVPPGAFCYLGKAIKAVVAIPVVACNRIDVRLAEELVDDGVADFIGMARGFVADAELASKALKGEYNAIRPCVACNQGCMDNIFSGKSLTCLGNAEAGREAELLAKRTLFDERKASIFEKILVIGAGVAGLEYARVAALHGHRVTVWEEAEELGGQVLLAAAPPGRQNLMRLIDYLAYACRSLQVDICCGKRATVDNVLTAVNTGAFERVVIATGVKSSLLSVPIEEGATVYHARDVLRKRVKTGKHVVIVGGGAVGVETALMLAEIGTIDAETLRFLVLNRAEKPEELYRLLIQGCKSITIVEMAKDIGKEIGPSTRWSMLAKLRRYNVNIREQEKVVAIKKVGVVVEKPEGREVIFADTVVLATGVESHNELYAGLRDKLDKLSLIGDARKPRKIQDAIREAYDAALETGGALT
jgi:2,4-dienoyl-CoA reductase (NADPH2)